MLKTFLSKRQYYFAVIILLSWPHLFFAQVLYPVKVDHQWGYIDYRGDVRVPPRYDLIDSRELPWHGWDGGDPLSGFKKVELDGKIGLIDRNMGEVLSPAYENIRPLSTHFFAVRVDTLFTVVDRTGNMLVEERYEDIHALDHRQTEGNLFFKVKVGDHWGVYQAGKGLVLPAEYDGIELVSAERKYFKVRQKEKGALWGMVNAQNQLVLPYTFEEIDGHHANFIATKSDYAKLWQVRDSLGNPKLDSIWLSFLKLNEQLIQIQDSTRQVYLYAFAKNDTLSVSGDYTTYAPLNEQYIIGIKNRRYAILDNAGNELLPPTYSNIKPYDRPDYFKVRKNYFWGIYKLGEGEVLQTDYDSIASFRNGFAKVIRARRTGVINDRFEEVIPPSYDSVKRDGNYFKAFSGNRLSVFELGEEGKIIGVEDFSQVFTLKVGTQRKLLSSPIEAKAIKRKKRTIDEAYFLEQFPSPLVLDDTPWNWKYDREAKHWGLLKGDTVINEPVFRTVQHIRQPMLSLVFTYDDPESGRTASNAGAPGESFCRLAIFGHRQGHMLTGFDFTGLRRHDFERGLPCAAAMQRDGNFCLVNAQGEVLKNSAGESLKFSYIGEFIDGVARASVGGEIRKVESPSENKFSIEDRYLFWQKFGLTNPMVKGLSQEVRLMVDSNRTEAPRWGFVDTLGHWVIPPEYDYVRDFDKGQAVAVKASKWGVIDSLNAVVIDFQYASISDYYGKWRISQPSQQTLLFNQRGWEIFSAAYNGRGNFAEGFCRVRQRDRWGYINQEGEEVAPFQFADARDFSGGLAAVNYQGKWGFIDTSGTIVINTAKLGIPIDTVSNFHDGLCWFRSGRKYGFINREGAIVIPPKYSMAFDFQHGVARVVELVDSTGFKTGLINPQGEYVLKPGRFERIYKFDQYGLAKVMEAFSAHEYGLINAKGDILTPVKYQEIQDFSEGFAAVRIGKAYGLVNRFGEEILPLEYQKVDVLSEGRVAVMPPNLSKWVYLDTLGQIAFKTYYDVASPYDKGYAEVTSNMFDPTSRHFIDHQGEPVTFKKGQVQFYKEGIFGMYTPRPPEKGQHYYYADREGNNIFDRHFQAIEPFEKGIAMVTQAWRRGVVNERGMTVIDPKYFFLQILDDGNIMVRPPSFGIADRQGRILIPPLYDRIQYMSGQVYQVEQGEKVGYLTYDGKWIWALRN